MTELQGCLVLSGLLFGVGLAGVMLRRNAILMLVGVELMLNAANLNFVAFWRYGGGATSMDGLIFVLFTLAVAAAEAAVGLALIIAVYRHHRTTHMDALDDEEGAADGAGGGKE